MATELGLPEEGALPRPKQHQVIEGGNYNEVFRSVAPANPNNERDDQGSFDEKDSSRQPSSPTVSFTKKRKVTPSFDETAGTTGSDEEEASVQIRDTTSRDSVSLPSFDSTDAPLLKLENVTEKSRSLISPELQLHLPPLHPNKNRKNMTTPAVSNNGGGNGDDPKNSRKGLFRKRLSLRRNSTQEEKEQIEVALSPSPTQDPQQPPEPPLTQTSSDPKQRRKPTPPTEATAATPQRSNLQRKAATEERKAGSPTPRRGVLQRIRSASRSRSKARNIGEVSEPTKPMLVAVTSCRSDAYYNQKAPGSTSKLPRKAPSNLKLFHELAVGIKDAYAAVGQTPIRPEEQEHGGGDANQKPESLEGNTILWEFIGNLDFVSTCDWLCIRCCHWDAHLIAIVQLLALVDEVAIDTATRGALKDDTTFKCLRDVIKKCNKVLEGMLVRRERRYTLFFRLVQASEPKEIAKIKSWNSKVEKAIGSVADSATGNETSESESDAGSVMSSASESSASAASSSRGGSILSRGRQLLPSAGRVRSRRATPTPTLRNRGGASEGSSSAEDGFAAGTPVTKGNLALLQKSMSKEEIENGIKNSIPALMPAPPPNQPQFANTAKAIEPKDELIDVIRGLRTEKIQKREGTAER